MAYLIPELTHEAIQTLCTLAKGEKSQLEMQEVMHQAGYPRERTTIHVMVRKLRLMRLIDGYGHPPKYEITDAGRDMIRQAQEFYREICKVPLPASATGARRRTIHEATHLRVAILSVLADGEKPGRVMRELLGWATRTKTTAAFYVCMANHEKLGLIAGRFARPPKQLTIAVRERLYAITEDGRNVLQEVQEFYRGILESIADA